MTRNKPFFLKILLGIFIVTLCLYFLNSYRTPKTPQIYKYGCGDQIMKQQPTPLKDTEIALPLFTRDFKCIYYVLVPKDTPKTASLSTQAAEIVHKLLVYQAPNNTFIIARISKSETQKSPYVMSFFSTYYNPRQSEAADEARDQELKLVKSCDNCQFDLETIKKNVQIKTSTVPQYSGIDTLTIDTKFAPVFGLESMTAQVGMAIKMNNLSGTYRGMHITVLVNGKDMCNNSDSCNDMRGG